ncbi:MFS transporter [Streptomyces desertarenae]|uniref:MFS transporter n=1 Tax=Streptomyces desertarenae TaxID=2666184 RepID=A0ABW4PHJ7_9ACTN
MSAAPAEEDGKGGKRNEAAGDAGTWGAVRTLRQSHPAVRFLLLGVFVNQVGGFVQPFLVLYLVWRGFSTGQAGIALTAYGVGTIAGVMFGAELADRLGPRRTIVLAMACAATLTAAVPMIGNYHVVVAVIAASGAMIQAYRPASLSLLTDLVPEERHVMVFSMNRIALNLGATVGRLFAAWLVTVSWNLLFWVSGLASLAYALIAVIALPRDGTARAGAADSGEAGDSGKTGEAGDGAVPGRAGYALIVRDVRFMLFLLAMFLSAAIFIQSFVALPLSMKEAGYSPTAYTWVITLSAAAIIALELLITRFTQRWPAWLAACAGLLLLGCGQAMYVAPQYVPLLVAATLVGVLGTMVGGPTMWTYPAKLAPPGSKGRYLGLTQAAFGLGSALGPVIGTFGWDALGNRVWLVWGALGLLSTLAAAVAMRPRAEPARHSAPTATPTP